MSMMTTRATVGANAMVVWLVCAMHAIQIQSQTVNNGTGMACSQCMGHSTWIDS